MASEITCAMCGEVKPHQAFGLCKACYLKQYKERNKEKLTAYHKAYEEKRRGARVEYNRTKSAESYRRNRKKVIERSRKQYQRTKVHRRAVSRVWDAAHRENKRQAWKRWFANKRANTPNNQGLTVAQWQAILAQYNHRCAYCGAVGIELTQDHIIPVSRGGADTQSNVVPACRSCNCQKGDKTPEEWGRWPNQSP